MSKSRGYSWGPRPLPEFVSEQLEAHGFSAGDAVRCAALINDRPADADAAGLFVDLGGCKFLEGDIDGAVAAWRHAISSRHDDAAARALLHTGLLYEHVQLNERAIGVLSSIGDRGVAEYSVPAAMATARCQRAVADYAEAVETMARVVQIAMSELPDSPVLADAFYALGEVAFDGSQFERAERAWRVAAAGESSPAQQAAADRLAELLLEHGTPDEVAELLEQHDGFGAHVPRVLDRIDAEARRGNESGALALAVSLRSHDLAPTDRFRLIELRLALDGAHEAIDELEFLLAHTDAEVQLRATFLLGEVYGSHDMEDPATAMFERVLDTGDQYWAPQAALRLGDLAHGQGDASAATAYWSHAAGSDLRAARTVAVERLRIAEAEAVAADQRKDSVGHDVHDATNVAVENVQLREDPQVVVLSSIEPIEPVAPVSPVEPVAPVEAEVVLTAPIEPVAPVEAEAVLTAPPLSIDVTSDHPVVPDATPTVIRLDDVDIASRDDGRSVGRDMRRNDVHVVAVDDLEVSSVATEIEVREAADVVSADSAEPVVVLLSAVEEAEPPSVVVADSGADSSEVDDAPAVVEPEQPQAAASFFSSQLGKVPESNPYAALAPDSIDGDVAPSARNPYAELAPNFADDDFQPASDVEPGDWESMLDDWPRHSDADDAPAKPKRSSAFSRYT